MPQKNDLQSEVFSHLIAERKIVSVFLKNGIKLTGKITGETKDIIFLSDPVLQLVYKSCVSTIVYA